MNEQIEKWLTATLNEYASEINPDITQAQHLVRHQLTASAPNWDESFTTQQSPMTTRDKTRFSAGDKPKRVPFPSFTKTPAGAKLQPLAVLSLLLAVILILSLLIISVAQPVSKEPVISASQTKVASQGQPSAVAASVAATAANNLYLGPDNTFHVGADSTQVSTGSSTPIPTTSQEANFQILWLVTDSNSTKLAIQISGAKLSFNANNNGVSTNDRGVGVLKDELGKTYPVKVSSSIPIPINNSTLNGATWWAYAPSLPSNVKKLSFIPDTGLPFTLSGNPQINLITYILDKINLMPI